MSHLRGPGTSFKIREAAINDGLKGVTYAEMVSDYKTLENELGPGLSSQVVAGYMTIMLLYEDTKINPTISSSKELYDALLKVKTVETPDGGISVVDRVMKFPLVEKTLDYH